VPGPDEITSVVGKTTLKSAGNERVKEENGQAREQNTT
jgi:hypothetical protein